MATPQTSPTTIVSSDDVTDAKLLHLVRKLINLSDGASPNSDYIVTILRTQHREYLRKDLQRLKAQVEAIVQQILGNDQSTAESRKRKALEDEEYDQHAALNDATREKLSIGGGLNASLRNRYQQVQQSRDVTAAEAAAAEAAERAAEEAAVTASESVFEGNTQGEQAMDQTPSEASEKRNKGSQKGDKSPGIKRRSAKSRKSPGSSMLGSPAGGEASFLTPVMRPTERYSDLGGMNGVVQQIRQLVEYPLIRPELYLHLGVDPPRGVLLRGPPGTGKTHLAKAGKL
jgi:ATP-dependent 26S proteasome regulatory subunit